MWSLPRRNASPWSRGRMPGLLLLVCVGLACGQSDPQVEPQLDPPLELHWDCQEQMRRKAMEKQWEEAHAEGTGWRRVDQMAEARSLHTATLLRSGKILVTGGSARDVWLKTAQLYEPASGTWEDMEDSLKTPRDNHMATLLSSGKVLVSGGFGGKGELTSAELYDPDTNAWSDAGHMVAARSVATMTCLPSGQVLVAGGSGSDYPNAHAIESRPLQSAEIYVPDIGWTLTGAMRVARMHHTATLLPSGKVLVTGGQTEDMSVVDTAEVYDPELGTWSKTGSMHVARHFHTATRLPSGRILVSGGRNNSNEFIADAEEYDPSTGEWTRTQTPMNTARDKHTATLLPSGKVLVSGGEGDRELNLISAEEYDPSKGEWRTLDRMNAARFWHTATLLLSGKVLLAGGSAFKNQDQIADAEVYDEPPAAPQVTSPTPNELFLNTWELRIAGTAEPGSIVELVLDGMGTIQVPVDANGEWSYEPTEPLGRGTHTFSASTVDRTGNVSEPAFGIFQLLARSHYGWH
jgi:N-acetylneuraminic acid mutarotase